MSRTLRPALTALLFIATYAAANVARAEGFNTKHLFVTDESNPLVAEIDEEGHLFNIFNLGAGVDGEAIGSSATQGVVMSPKGTMLVVRGRNTIVQVKPNGNKKIGMAPTATFPSYVTVGPQGRLYAAGNDGVHVFAIIDNPALPSLTITDLNTISNGGKLVPKGLAFGPDGMLYVADASSGSIQRFTPDGMFVGSFGELESPEGLIFLPDGSLLAADDATNSIEHIDAGTGNTIESFTDKSLNAPRGLALTQLGTVMICSTTSDNVLALDIDTGNFSLFSFEVSNPFACAVAPQRFKVSISGKMRVDGQKPAQTLQNEEAVLALDPATGNAVLDLKGDENPSPELDFVSPGQGVLGQDMFTFNGFISFAETSAHRQMHSTEAAQPGPTSGGADLTMLLNGTPGPFRFNIKTGSGRMNVYGPNRVGQFDIRLKKKLN